MVEVIRMVVIICGVTTAGPECTVDRSIETVFGPTVSSAEACLILAEVFERDRTVRQLALQRQSAGSFSIVCMRDRAAFAMAPVEVPR